MTNYLNYYEIQHLNPDFEKLIHYLQDAVKENKLQITKEVVDRIINIIDNKELFEEQLEKEYDEGFNDGYKDGKSDGYDNGYSEGHYAGYEEAKQDIQNPNLEQIKQKIADEKYREGYFIGYDHARRKWEPKIDNDDLPL